MRPSVSLCVIVRNEEENLVACLEPLRSLVDEIIVVDTGSTDRTTQIAAQLGAKVFSFPWGDDFSAARNESLRHATGDWVLWVDADDRMDEENLKGLASLFDGLGPQSPDVFTFQVLSPIDSAVSSGAWVTHGRLFRRAANLHWVRRVHEELVPADHRDAAAWPEVGWSGLVVRHVGYQDPARRRLHLRRDLRLLQLDFAVNPDDPLTLLYLGWGHLEEGNLRQALRYLRRGMANCPIRHKLLALLAQTLSRLEQKREALETCQEGLADFPDDPELLYLAGLLMGELRDQSGAERSLLKLVNLGPQRHYHLAVEDGLQTEKGPFMLGLLYHEQRRFTEAESQFCFAIRHHTRSSQAWLGLGQLYLTTGNWSGLQNCLLRLRECPTGDVLAPVLEARWLIVRREFAAALRLLNQAIARDPQLLWPRLVLSDLAMQGTVDHATAVEIHREILELAPHHPIARERLRLLLAEAPKPAEPSPWAAVTSDAPVESVNSRGSSVFIACR
jgi:tetratricopeptide (TPR) repeat protein